MLLGSGITKLRGISYNDHNNKTTPWRVKWQGKTIKRFHTKRQAADFYFQYAQLDRTTIGNFIQEYNAT